MSVLLCSHRDASPGGAAAIARTSCSNTAVQARPRNPTHCRRAAELWREAGGGERERCMASTGGPWTPRLIGPQNPSSAILEVTRVAQQRFSPFKFLLTMAAIVNKNSCRLLLNSSFTSLKEVGRSAGPEIEDGCARRCDKTTQKFAALSSCSFTVPFAPSQPANSGVEHPRLFGSAPSAPPSCRHARRRRRHPWQPSDPRTTRSSSPRSATPPRPVPATESIQGWRFKALGSSAV